MSEYVFKLPDLGEGTVEAEIAEWNVSVGDEVTEEDVIGAVLTEKAAVEIPSPVSGRVVSLAGEPGDVIAVGAPLITFETGSEAPNHVSNGDIPMQAREAVTGPVFDRKTSQPAIPASAPTATGTRTRVVSSPAIRRRAAEAGVDLARVPGTGPRGRILREDLGQYLEQSASAKTPFPATRAPGSPVAATTEVKVIGLRRIIAERMTKANRDIPHFSYVEEIDITRLQELRQFLNARRSDGTAKLTLLPFIGIALVRALHRFPQCNTTFEPERNTLLRHEAVHLGIATQTPDGLKVPVVRHCERLTVEELAAGIRHGSEAARDNSIKPADLSGSTITITSLGTLGGIVTTPIINQPEVAIIGVNKAVQRPVVIDGQITVRTMMNLSSSFDHRFVDGYDAAAMIQSLKDLLEHPATLFL